MAKNDKKEEGKMVECEVLHALKHDGKMHGKGERAMLPEETAADLAARGVVRRPGDAPAAPAVKPAPGAEAKKEEAEKKDAGDEE